MKNPRTCRCCIKISDGGNIFRIFRVTTKRSISGLRKYFVKTGIVTTNLKSICKVSSSYICMKRLLCRETWRLKSNNFRSTLMRASRCGCASGHKYFLAVATKNFSALILKAGIFSTRISPSLDAVSSRPSRSRVLARHRSGLRFLTQSVLTLCSGSTVSLCSLCSRQESNPHCILRKDASYPLNDGSVVRQCSIFPVFST